MRFIETLSLLLLILAVEGCDDLIPFTITTTELPTDLPINDQDVNSGFWCSLLCKSQFPLYELCDCSTISAFMVSCKQCRVGYHCVQPIGENAGGCCPGTKIPCSNRPDKCCEPRPDLTPAVCCADNTAYDSDRGDCCNTDPQTHVTCCGGDCIKIPDQKCCTDGLRPVLGSPNYSYGCDSEQECCGGECQRPERDQCCVNFFARTFKVCRKEEKCCLKNCCKENEECCNGECYDPLKEGECCNGRTICSTKEKCCGYSCINTLFYQCCPGSFQYWQAFRAPLSHECCHQISCPKGQCVIDGLYGHCESG